MLSEILTPGSICLTLVYNVKCVCYQNGGAGIKMPDRCLILSARNIFGGLYNRFPKWLA